MIPRGDNSSTDRQLSPDSADVELFVPCDVVDVVLSWVQVVLGRATEVDRVGDIVIHSIDNDVHGRISVTITPGIGRSKLTSLFIAGPRLPWYNDSDCARQLVQRVGIKALVHSGRGSVNTEWLEVDAKGERISFGCGSISAERIWLKSRRSR